MRSLELIKKLNEDPALRMPNGITVRRLAERIRSLIELRKLDPDAYIYFEDATITTAVAECRGQLVLSDVIPTEEGT